ncbi:MAG TPA: hypothetical protein VE177_01140 [Candidatus Binatus sp.]|nr:hypothetical protein [Candidatus Binatus sp.]
MLPANIYTEQVSDSVMGILDVLRGKAINIGPRKIAEIKQGVSYRVNVRIRQEYEIRTLC